MNIRANTFTTTVLPALPDACGIWSATKRDEEIFVVARIAMERRMCDVTKVDRLNNEELRHRTGVKDVVFGIYAAKWSGASHIA